MIKVKINKITALMIEGNIILSVLAQISSKGALVTTCTGLGEVQTRILLYFANDKACWRDL